MSVSRTHWCWRRDLAGFRGLSDFERSGFLLVLEWFENFRLRNDLEAGREAARIFWRTEAKCEERPREAWQLEQWEAALQWYIAWLDACAEAKADHRSLPERVRAAVQSAGSRRLGLLIGLNNKMGEIDETSVGGRGTTNLSDLTNPGLLKCL